MGILQKGFDLGKDAGGAVDGAEILGVGGAVDDLGDEALQVENVGQKLADLLTHHEGAVQLFHGVLTADDLVGGQQGMLHPTAQHAGPRGGLGLVQHPQERSLLFLGAHGLGQLQVAAGVHIQLQILTFVVDEQFLYVGKVVLLGLGEVVKKRANGTDQGFVFKDTLLEIVTKLG